MLSDRGSCCCVENTASSKVTPTCSHLMDHQWARVPAGFFLNVADIWTRMHRHACIEVYNAPMTSTAVKITIIIVISVLLYTNVVIIEIHACLYSKLLPWSQKLPRNRSFRVGSREEVPHVIPKVEVHSSCDRRSAPLRQEGEVSRHCEKRPLCCTVRYVGR